MDSSLIQNSVNISRTHDSFLPKLKKNLDDNEDGKNNNILTEFNYDAKEIYSRNLEKNKNPKIKLEDGISINIIKSHGEKRIKKFLHIPDFEIYIIKVCLYEEIYFSIINIGNSINKWQITKCKYIPKNKRLE